MRASLGEPDSSAAVSDELGPPLDLEERMSRGRLMFAVFQINNLSLLAQPDLAAIDMLNKTRFGAGVRLAVLSLKWFSSSRFRATTSCRNHNF